MGFGVLFISILGGYLFVQRCHFARLTGNREGGYHVLFRSAVPGAIFLAGAWAIEMFVLKDHLRCPPDLRGRQRQTFRDGRVRAIPNSTSLHRRPPQQRRFPRGGEHRRHRTARHGRLMRVRRGRTLEFRSQVWGADSGRCRGTRPRHVDAKGGREHVGDAAGPALIGSFSAAPWETESGPRDAR